MNSEDTTVISVELRELTEALAPLVAAQLLSAYYASLSHARQQGDARSDDEIFRDCMGEFLLLREMLKATHENMDELDVEALLQRRGPNPEKDR
jgi:hypothetical protein